MLSPDDRLLAAELALRLIDGEELRAARERQAVDESFAEAVAEWERSFAPLFDEVAPVQPGERVWDAIAAGVAAPASGGGSGSVITPDFQRTRRALQRWRAIAVGAMSIAAALLLAVLLRPVPSLPPATTVAPAPTEAIVAQLSDGEGGAILTARLDLADDLLRVRPTAIPEGAGEPELWVIPAADQTPRSLGLIRRDGATEILLPTQLREQFADGATLALTLEPREGAPHAAPTGTILSTARITRL
nr:anti-sigma factor [Sphingomonas japonica]